MVSLVAAAKRQLTLVTHRLHALPVLVLMPHSRCNCRCVMCDIWKANQHRQELTTEDLAPHLATFRQLGVQQVTLSGGEALMHANLWRLCALLRELGAAVILLSTGLLLRRHAAEIAQHCAEVIVSLDGSREVHDQIRRVPRAYDQLAAGVKALREQRADLRVTGRTVLQKRNFMDLPRIIDAAHTLGLDRISFLAADVSSTAFNRPDPWDAQRQAEVALDLAEAHRFAELIERTLVDHRADFAQGFVAESPAKLRRLGAYYLALHGEGDLPAPRCNAPWVSAVVEADGTVRPCFFHRSLGNLHQQPLAAILNGAEAVTFRQQLEVASNPTCQRCVCSLHLAPWQGL